MVFATRGGPRSSGGFLGQTVGQFMGLIVIAIAMGVQFGLTGIFSLRILTKAECTSATEILSGPPGRQRAWRTAAHSKTPASSALLYPHENLSWA